MATIRADSTWTSIVASGEAISRSVGRGSLVLVTARLTSGSPPEVGVLVESTDSEHSDVSVRHLVDGRYLRRFRDENRTLIHGVPAKVGTVACERLRGAYNWTNQDVIERLVYQPLGRDDLVLELKRTARRVVVWSPDLAGPRDVGSGLRGEIGINLSGIERYFIVEILWEEK